LPAAAPPGETRLEGRELLDLGLLHLPEHARIDVLGGDFQQAAGVVLGQFPHISRVPPGQVHADA